MAVKMGLWSIDAGGLREMKSKRLDLERRLEEWIARDPSVLAMDILILATQVQTAHGGRIDILAIDRDANSVIVELKRDRTPRDAVAQVLDYASWVKSLGYDDLERIADLGTGKLRTAFEDHFGQSIPETVNDSVTMVLVAAELDDSSERIIEYLSEGFGVRINAVFFEYFMDPKGEFLARAWLRDPEDVPPARAEKRPPWTGYWFVNVGESEHRNWDDNRRYGFVSAGNGTKWGRNLQKLKVGDQIFAYLRDAGYVGFGRVTKEAQKMRDYRFEDDGRHLKDLELAAPQAMEYLDDDERCEWIVGVEWSRALPREQAKWFKGAFANQNNVCRLRHPETLDFLRKEFGAK